MSQEIGMVGSKVYFIEGVGQRLHEPSPPPHIFASLNFDGVLKEWRKCWLSETAQLLPHLKA